MIRGRYQPRRGSRIEGMRRPPRAATSSVPAPTGLRWNSASMTPDNPDIGDAYFDAARYATYVWDGFQWVELVTQEEEERRTAKRQMQHFIQQANTYSWTVNGTVVNNRVVNNHVVSNHVVSNHVDHYGVQPNEAWIIPDTTGGTP